MNYSLNKNCFKLYIFFSLFLYSDFIFGIGDAKTNAKITVNFFNFKNFIKFDFYFANLNKKIIHKNNN